MTPQDQFDVLKPGTVIGEKYQIIRLLGAGGMGAVYEAENTWTTRHVAIKVLNPMLSGDKTSIDRFKGEAQAASRLAHPNIVDILDMGADPITGILFIVQEFLQGRDLYAHFEERKRLQPAEAAELLVPVMAALAVAHERGIIHRDIKPENIFLHRMAGEIVPKLIDFGLSKVLGETAASRKTTTGTVMGTPYYMSPEQVRGDRAIDARTDVWAMGALMFEMISGQVPFDDASANLLMFKIMSEPPPRIESVVPGLDPAVAEVIRRALEPDIDKRFPTMRPMLEAVLACQGFENVGKKTTMRERHARSIDHRAPSHSSAPTLPAAERPSSAGPTSEPAKSAQSNATPKRSTDDSWTDRSLPPPARPSRRALWAGVSLLGVLALSGALWRTTHPATSPAAQVAEAAASPLVPAPSPALAVRAASPAPAALIPPVASLEHADVATQTADATVVLERPTAPFPEPEAPPTAATNRHHHPRRQRPDLLQPLGPN